MDALKVIDKMVKNLEPIVEAKDLAIIKESYLANKEGIQAYLDKFYPPEELLEKRAVEFADSADPEGDEKSKEKLRLAYIQNYRDKGGLAADLGIDEASLNTAYTLGYASYSAGRYAEARDFFALLVFWDPNDPNFHFGLAASHHMLKNYQFAIEQYLACIASDIDNPIPWFHMADCYIQLENWKMALVNLKAVLIRTEGKEEFAEIRKKVKLLKAVAIRKIEELSLG